MSNEEEKEVKLFWKCGKCGYNLSAKQPPEKCPSCGLTCEFVNITNYVPGGDPGAPDPRLE